MNRATVLWNRWSNDNTARLTAVGAIPAVWLSIALYDVRFMLIIPLAAIVAVVLERVRGRNAPPVDDDFVL